MTEVQERERKYALSPGVGAADLAGALEGAGQLSTSCDAVLLAAYFDTRRMDLATAGITLRRRQGGADAGWHLKLPAGPDERTEYWLPLGAGRDGRVPADLADMLEARTGGRPLAPVAVVRTRRTALEVAAPGGRPLAEVADDRVVAVRARDQTALAWREIEVEARVADDDALDDLGTRLEGVGGERAPYPSKLARVLGAPPCQGKEDLLAARLAAQLAALVWAEAGVRDGDPEGLHDLRVAIRRLRSFLRSFAGAFEQDGLGGLADQLARAGRVLGTARDAEVLAARLEAELGEVPTADVLGPVRAVLRSHAAREAAASARTVRDLLDGPEYLALLEHLVAVVAAPPLGPGRRGRAYLRDRLDKERRRVGRRVQAVGRRTGAERDAALHAVRKAVKQARYAAETAETALGKEARRDVRRYLELQEILGEHHDAVVARAFLRAEGARAGVRPGENGFTFGLLCARQDARAAAADRRFHKRWQALQRRGR